MTAKFLADAAILIRFLLNHRHQAFDKMNATIDFFAETSYMEFTQCSIYINDDNTYNYILKPPTILPNSYGNKMVFGIGLSKN